MRTYLRDSTLAWCLEHADKAPNPAWLREVYYHLGKLALNDGDTSKAQDNLRRSGYSDFDHPITLATPFSEDRASGHAFAPRRITEVVPSFMGVATIRKSLKRNSTGRRSSGSNSSESDSARKMF